MSTSHRWVRIKTLEEMMKLLEINNVVITEVVCDIFKLRVPKEWRGSFLTSRSGVSTGEVGILESEISSLKTDIEILEEKLHEE